MCTPRRYAFVAKYKCLIGAMCKVGLASCVGDSLHHAGIVRTQPRDYIERLEPLAENGSVRKNMNLGFDILL